MAEKLVARTMVRSTAEIQRDPFAGPILRALWELDMGTRFRGMDYEETAEMIAGDIRVALVAHVESAGSPTHDEGGEG